MKRENLQRANELEKQIIEKENQIRSIRVKPYVSISVSPNTSTLMGTVPDIYSEDPFDKEAAMFIDSVRRRIEKERDSLLKEMEEL